MGFSAVFSNPNSGQPAGGGVTSGQEPWNAPVPSTTVTINRQAKPMVLLVSLPLAERQVFLERMASIMAQGVAGWYEGDGYVRGESGIVWVPATGPVEGLHRLSIALENAGFDPTRCAMQVYHGVAVGGSSGLVKWQRETQMAVKLVYGDPANPKEYQGVHNTDLALASPMVFATEVKTFCGL